MVRLRIFIKFINEKCPGCAENKKATWCAIRSCCIEKGISNCSACTEYSNIMDCRKYNNVFARVIGFLTSTDRSLCIDKIKKEGEGQFILFMDEKEWKSIPRNIT